jgi:hypothetical protein
VSLFLVSIVAVPLVVSLDALHQRFQELHELEKAVIAVDNACIVIGKSYRQILNQLDARHRKVLQWERMHHWVHACASSGAASTVCLLKDKAVEAAIRSNVQAALVAAQAEWSRATFSAQSHAKALGVGAELERSFEVPLRAHRCSVCGLAVGWEPAFEWRESVGARVLQRNVRCSVRAIRRTDQWNYEVFLE